jgi:streptogramin lyase
MNACTQADACNAGMCVGGNPVVCMATDQCHVAGMCNPMTGTCTNPNAPDGTPCNDGSDCSQGDACQGGVCTGTGSSVTEYASVVPQPKEITPGPDGNLWFVSTEAAPGVGAVARIAPASGAVTSYLTSAPPRPSAALVDDIVAGPNGNLWFTERFPDLGDLPGIAEITPAGVFVVPDLLGNPGGTITSGSDGFIWTGGSYIGAIDIVFRNTELGSIIAVMNTPRSIAPGPDGNIWFVASNGGALPALVGRVVPSDILGGEVLTEFPVMTPGNLNDIVGGPDGNLWFTDEGSNQIGRITPAGVITKFSVPTAASGLHGIVLGPDGNLWFTERVANKIGRITTAGVVTELACIPTANSGPTNIALGADGKLWFTQTAVNKIATIAP